MMEGKYYWRLNNPKQTCIKIATEEFNFRIILPKKKIKQTVFLLWEWYISIRKWEVNLVWRF
jgi:hypothetical protein